MPATTASRPPGPAPTASVTELRSRLRERLGVEHPEPAWWAWVVALVVGAVAGLLRFVRLGTPPSLVFDETYYVKQAYSYLLTGYELQWLEDPAGDNDDYANDLFESGQLDAFQRTPDFVVHPPLGKWMIAAGMRIDPDDTFFWRFSAAVAGTISVVLVVLIARRLFDSTLLGGIAGLLLAADGHHLVHSRTGLLDIFVSFWVVVAFAFLLADRFQGRARLADRMARSVVAGRVSPYGPWLGVRWYRVAAGVALGGACATKWSGLYVVAAFGLLTVAWDLGARRAVGVERWLTGTLLRDALIAFVAIVPVAFLTYLASWFGWFRSDDAYNRTWALENPDEAVSWLPSSLASLWHYHVSAYTFHVGLNTTDNDHPYMANPWSWLVQARPTSFFYDGTDDGVTGCGSESCSQAINSLGNPVVWWGATIALVVCLAAWLLRRDWRAGAVVVGVAAGYLPWFAYQERTIFTFYAVAFVPFLVLALTYALGLLLGPPTASAQRRRWGAVAVGAVVLAALACLWFFYPIWTAQVITRDAWDMRMWWPSWV